MDQGQDQKQDKKQNQGQDRGPDQGHDRQRRIAEGEKSRSIAQERQAKRTAEIAGKQAQLKLEAQQRAEQRSKKN
jgi:hypothetical protein